MMMKFPKNRNIKFPVYYFVIICFLLISIITLINSHGELLYNLLFGHGDDLFMDFFNHIAYVKKNGLRHVYEQGFNACFPALSYLFYAFLGEIIPPDSVTMYHAAKTTAYAHLLYVIYCVILSILFCYFIELNLKNRSQSIILTLTIFLSNVFIFGVIERGNSVWIVCILLLLFAKFRESENLAAREAALILIAIATGFKVYPCLFGLLYVFEKRWKEMVRLLVYGISLFIIPFAWCGGIEGFKLFITNQFRLQNTSNTVGNLYYMTNLLRQKQGINIPIYEIFMAVFFFILCLGLALSDRKWKKYLLICSFCILVPKWSVNYTLIYIALPLTIFFHEAESSLINHIYSILFGIIFSFITFGSTWKGRIFGMNLSMTLLFMSLWIIWILQIVSICIKSRERIKGCYDQK